jgi:hypothetical protein
MVLYVLMVSVYGVSVKPMTTPDSWYATYAECEQVRVAKNKTDQWVNKGQGIRHVYYCISVPKGTAIVPEGELPIAA